MKLGAKRSPLLAPETAVATIPPNQGTPWSDEDVQLLKQLISENTPTRIIGLKLSRSEESIYSKVSDLGLSLKPTNQSPAG